MSDLIPQVYKSSELKSGENYVLRDKFTKKTEMALCKSTKEKLKFFLQRVWATDKNAEVFVYYDVFGPVDFEKLI